LLSVILSGAILALLGGFTFAAVQRINLQRIDGEMRELAHRYLTAPPERQDWEWVSASLRFFLGDDSVDAFTLLIDNGETSHRTPNWPEALSSSLTPPPGPAADAAPSTVDASAPLRRALLFNHAEEGAQWRVIVTGTPGMTFALGVNLKRVNAGMVQVSGALALGFVVALLLIAACAWWLSRRALRPIDALATTLERVTAKGLDQRISGQDEALELVRLITVFNEMMDRLEKSFHQAFRFSADASHELKTPLTILQGKLERAILDAEPESEKQRRYTALSEEVQRLKSIVRKLLLLSRVDAGTLKLQLRPLELSRVLEGVSEDVELLAPHLEVRGDLAAGVWVMADADLIKQVVQNLTTNAVKYNRHGGFIALKLRVDARTAQLTVSNSGKGVRAEDRDKVFERFFRGDKTRNRTAQGVGLGLSLAREIARAHHGDLRLEETPEGVTAFSLLLTPCAAPH
jgi:signal transduction histidine kinase